MALRSAWRLGEIVVWRTTFLLSEELLSACLAVVALLCTEFSSDGHFARNFAHAKTC